MRRFKIVPFCFMLIVLFGCQPFRRIVTHELVLEEVNRIDEPVKSWIFGDLKGTEEDFLITADTQAMNLYAICVQNQCGKVVSQINLGAKIRGLRVLSDPRDDSRWLFFTYNDQRSVTIAAAQYQWKIPLQREERMFESILRTDRHLGNPNFEWLAMVYPEILADIDGDGRLELVCRMIDGFTVNPRGLVVYDFETGRIKWRFDTSTSFNSVLFDDFDNDGNREFILSNFAFRNSMEVKHGMDDSSGWIMVLDNKGNRLYTQKEFDGYGQVHLTTADIDQDGIKEIYVVNTTWGSENIRNSVSIQHWDGKRLKKSKSWAQPSTFERTVVAPIMNEMDNAHTRRILLVDKGFGLVVLNENLEKVEHSYTDFVKVICAVEDITQEGNKEILLLTEDNHFAVLDSKINLVAKIKNPFPDSDQVSAHIVKNGFAKERLIAIVSPREVHYYRLKLLPLPLLIYRFAEKNAIFISILFGFIILALLIHYFRRRRMFMLATNTLSQGLILLSTKNHICFANQYVRDLISGKETHGKHLHINSLRESLPDLYTAMVEFCDGSESAKNLEMKLGEERLEHKVTIFKLYGLRKRYMITLIPLRQISELVQDKLLWADIARRLSHHVRRHITNVLLALNLLQQGESGEDKSAEYIKIIKDEIDKIRVFTHAFQRFTELKDYDLKRQDIIPSVEHCLSRIHIPENVRLIKNWQLNSLEAFIEPIRFEEALTNLINNSLEAMPDGGILHITINEFPLHDCPKGALTVLVEIEDSGIGIPQKYMEEIWRPFFTTNQSGTGIGIPESQKIIDSMGGSMSISSEEGIGTVVSIWLKGSVRE
ncbi:MAG: ATP-binding protein [Candidatus Cloacimonadaceae bacterium]|nr:ATP-binding protein [Candidatus Cloacimonadaceae bacterium]MDP3113992.1 ATP-binding protein [Candidatus Cloacimonadaceae bacterium]